MQMCLYNESTKWKYTQMCLESWFYKTPNGECNMKPNNGALYGELFIPAVENLINSWVANFQFRH